MTVVVGDPVAEVVRLTAVLLSPGHARSSAGVAYLAGTYETPAV